MARVPARTAWAHRLRFGRSGSQAARGGRVQERDRRRPARPPRWRRRPANGSRRVGHAPQVVPQPDSVSLFHLDGARTPIKRQGDQFVVGDAATTADALAAEAAAASGAVQPERSAASDRSGHALPDHLLRAGPSELAYLGQLREVYQALRRADAAVYPRATRDARRFGDSTLPRPKYDVPLEDLQPQDESALNKLLQSQLPPTVEAGAQGGG